MAKVFQILVPDNTLVSRIIMCENQVTELFVIDRADKKFVSEYSNDLNKPALYILVNRDKRQLYVGETDDSIKRLRNHEAKDFWTEAIVFHSTTDTLSTTEVKWLEAKTYEALKELGYYDLSENKQVPQQPPLKRNQIYTLEPIFEEAKNYICAAGFDIFLKKKEQTVPQEQHISFKEDNPTAKNVWLICYDSKYFKVEDCFKKYGEIYWTHKAGVLNVQKGDIAYLYAARPESAIRFKVEVVASQLPYSKEMDVEDEFVTSGSSNSDDSNKTYFLVRPIADTHSPALKHAALMSKGFMGKRPSTTKLSKDEFKALREYIEQNFDDTTPAEETTALQKKAKSKKQEKPKAKTDRRPPFKFSMIGLKPGDVVYFEHGDIPVTVVSENTVAYDNDIYTLSRFCKHFMPEEGSENREYQGPAHFILNGKTLDEIRKEKEKKL